MDIEEFRATFIRATEPLVEFARQVRRIFLEFANQLRETLLSGLVADWQSIKCRLLYLRRHGNRKERRYAWKVLHDAKRQKRPQKRRGYRSAYLKATSFA